MPKKWKTLGRKDAEKIYWILFHVIRSGRMEDADFPDSVKNETDLFRRSYIVSPLEKIRKEIDDLYKLS